MLSSRDEAYFYLRHGEVMCRYAIFTLISVVMELLRKFMLAEGRR